MVVPISIYTGIFLLETFIHSQRISLLHNIRCYYQSRVILMKVIYVVLLDLSAIRF